MSVQVIHESSRDPLKIRVVHVLFPCVSKIRAAIAECFLCVMRHEVSFDGQLVMGIP